MTQLSDNEYLFTSESVTEGHPDKVADQISDGVLDAVLRDDPMGRVACETLVNTGLVVVSGEISTSTYVDIQKVARDTIRQIGYTDADLGFSADSCAVINAIDKQSPDIAQGVDLAYESRTDPSDDDALDVAGAGDQGMMFGYASRETEELMPLPISLAHKLARRLAAVRHAGDLSYLRPDGKTQVTVRYRDGVPVEIERVLISTQHKEGAEPLIPDDLWEHVIEPVLPRDLYDAKKLRKSLLVNPTGRFVIGGPVGDAGLTGRKIIVDTYGGMARHGGGAFSGKDPSKVDRSAAYAARYVAKNVVAAGLADRCEVQVAYAIGVAHPVSVLVETFGTEKIGRGAIAGAGRRALRPAPGRVPQLPQPAPPDLPEDRRLRPLRSRRPRLHVGEDRQGRDAARRRRPGRRRGFGRLGERRGPGPFLSPTSGGERKGPGPLLSPRAPAGVGPRGAISPAGVGAAGERSGARSARYVAKLYAAERDHVAVLEARLGYALAVDQDAVAGAVVEDAHAVVVAHDHRVAARDALVVELDLGLEGAADPRKSLAQAQDDKVGVLLDQQLRLAREARQRQAAAARPRRGDRRDPLGLLTDRRRGRGR